MEVGFVAASSPKKYQRTTLHPLLAGMKLPDEKLSTRSCGSRTCKRLAWVTPHSMVLVPPSHHFSYTQFSAPPRNACRRMIRHCVSSASGTKVGTVSKTHFELKALSFVFVPKGTMGRLQRLDSAESTLLKLDRSLARKPPAAIVSELTRAACRLIRKAPGRRLSPSVSKASSLGWLAHELANGT